MKYLRAPFKALLLAALLLLPALAAAQNELPSATTASGGGQVTGANNGLYGVLGQPASGVASDASHAFNVGFLYRTSLAPSFFIGVLAGSVTKSYLSVYAVSSRVLDSDPQAQFSMGGPPTNQILSRLMTHGSVYHTSYKVPGTGDLTIRVTGAAAGLLGETTRIYTVASLTMDSPFVVVSSDGMAELSGSRGAVTEEGYVLLSSIDRNRPIPKFIRELKGIGTTGHGNLRPIGNMFEILSTTPFSGGVVLSLRYDSDDLQPLRSGSEFDERKIGIYQLRESEWSFVGGYAQDGTVSASIDKTGMYAMFYNPDLTPPPVVAIPKALELAPNYPNPFNPATTIRFGIPEEGMVRLAIYNVRGQLVKVLIDGVRSAGYDVAKWDGTDAHGQPVGTGMYFTRLENNGVVKTNKMVLLK